MSKVLAMAGKKCEKFEQTEKNLLTILQSDKTYDIITSEKGLKPSQKKKERCNHEEAYELIFSGAVHNGLRRRLRKIVL